MNTIKKYDQFVNEGYINKEKYFFNDDDFFNIKISIEDIHSKMEKSEDIIKNLGKEIRKLKSSMFVKSYDEIHTSTKNIKFTSDSEGKITFDFKVYADYDSNPRKGFPDSKDQIEKESSELFEMIDNRIKQFDFKIEKESKNKGVGGVPQKIYTISKIL